MCFDTDSEPPVPRIAGVRRPALALQADGSPDDACRRTLGFVERHA